MLRRLSFLGLAVSSVLLLMTAPAFAAEASAESVAIDTVWTMVAAFLVFLMQAGFSFLEGGLTRAKNVGNIMMKNIMDFGIASLSYWAVGFAIMFGAGNALFGTSGWFLSVAPGQVDKVFGSLSWTGIPLEAKWFFQMVFAGVAATIVSGAMAERTKFQAYLIYSAVITALIYPVVGHWIWGGGWLGSLGFQDFAGSTVVHGVGAWAALAGVLLIGPRLGKYGPKGEVRAIPGHSMPMAMLGVFILWFGWFGFNAGSTMGAMGGGFAAIAVTTNLAAAAATITGMLTAWSRSGKPDVTLTAGAAIAGLVAITAPSAFVEPWAAVLIGAVAGVIYVLAVIALDRLRIDDPVGAIPAHGIAGAFGTLATGLLASPRLVEAAGVGKAGFFYTGNPDQLAVQATGVVAVFGFVFLASLGLFAAIKATVGLRVSEEEEIHGLDIHEHGMWGYPEQFIPDLPAQTAQHYREPGIAKGAAERIAGQGGAKP